MIPSQVRSLKHHLKKVNEEISVLNFASIYGANAAGKSNFIKALQFSQTLIVSSEERIRKSVVKESYYKGEILFKEKNSDFEFDLIIGEEIFTYGFSINLFNFEIKNEWLYKRVNNEDIKLYEIDHSKEIKIDDICLENLEINENDRERFKVYISDANKSSSLFLQYINAVERKVDYSIELYRVYEWFSNSMEVISTYDGAKGSEDAFLNEEDTEKLAEFLKDFGTGIERIERQVISKQDIDDINRKSIDSLADRLIDINKQDESEIAAGMIQTNENIYFFSIDDNDELVIERIYFIHEGTSLKFPLRAESDGTRRLIEMYGVLNTVKDKVYIIDEIDRSFHPNLTYEFIKRALSNSKIQLIITTHEDRLLDLKLLRRDEIWFVDKLKNESRLYSLEDYKVRFDKDIMKDYLSGKYGSIPTFNNLFE
ncbi:AAA family ATPase [Streptococcus sp. 343_SSPC]|uniref:AAA family ATPase n=1 Tax=Streptococcus sp. 343_SSPC TaxID=1579342 RepID=UPI0006609DCA|nr:ATP-binding protein [Streptococcus sp. 343_SSPC]